MQERRLTVYISTTYPSWYIGVRDSEINVSVIIDLNPSGESPIEAVRHLVIVSREGSDNLGFGGAGVHNLGDLE